jgi:hypothetical protein
VDRAEQPGRRAKFVTDPGVAAADGILRRHGIRYLVVGGQAVGREAATATQDVDVMVTTSDYRDAVARLGADPELTKAWEGGPVVRFGIRALNGIPLDVVDSGFFAGKRTGKDFFEFLIREESSENEGVRYITTAGVWYMRLMTKRWRAYAEKIVTNVIDGVDPRRLDRVAAISRAFGTEATVQTRLAYVRAELARPDLVALIRRE